MKGIFVDFPSKIVSDFLMLTSLHFQSVTQSCHKETLHVLRLIKFFTFGVISLSKTKSCYTIFIKFDLFYFGGYYNTDGSS